MYNAILLPVALDQNSHLDQAFALAELLRNPTGHIRLLHVVEAIPAYVSASLPEDLRSKPTANAEAALKDLARKHGNPDIAVVTGHSGRTILEYAAQHDTDCIIIASHRPGLQDYFLGSTAAHVVRHATCAVHVLR
jgi:nucleotide-binding universal stress UspA family protein